jgi:hypothetical protein
MPFRLACSALLVVLAAVSFGEEKKPNEEGFKTIFDGKSMDGWKVSENPAQWSPMGRGPMHFMLAMTNHLKTFTSSPK